MTQEQFQQRWCHGDAPLQPARGHAGAAHHSLDSHAPSAAAAVTHNHSLPVLKAGSLPRL